MCAPSCAHEQIAFTDLGLVGETISRADHRSHPGRRRPTRRSATPGRASAERRPRRHGRARRPTSTSPSTSSPRPPTQAAARRGRPSRSRSSAGASTRWAPRSRSSPSRAPTGSWSRRPGESDPGEAEERHRQDRQADLPDGRHRRCPRGRRRRPHPARRRSPARRTTKTLRRMVVKRRSLVTGEMLTERQAGHRPRTTRPTSTSLQRPGRPPLRRGRPPRTSASRSPSSSTSRIISAPVIQLGRSPAARGQITGNFTEESAHDLALLLNSGALPAPLNVIEQHTVGAELGADAVKRRPDLRPDRRGPDLRLHHPGLRPVRRLRGHRPGRQRPDDRRAR